jgi:hypothetical protein
VVNQRRQNNLSKAPKSFLPLLSCRNVHFDSPSSPQRVNLSVLPQEKPRNRDVFLVAKPVLQKMLDFLALHFSPIHTPHIPKKDISTQRQSKQ